MPGPFSSAGLRLALAVVVFVVLAVAITSRPAKRMVDFDQAFYFTIAYDLDRHGVFSNGVFDTVDSTRATPPPGMFFAPLYPWLISVAMKIDARFAAAVRCTIEANERGRGLSRCEIYAWPMLLIHALLLAIGVLAIGRSAELILGDPRAFYVAGALATAAVASEAELLSYVMSESTWFCLYGLLMLSVVLALKTGRGLHFALAGLALGVLSLTRASFLILVPVLPALFALYAIRAPDGRRPWLRNTATFGFVLLLTIAPWLARNYTAFGKLAFTEEYGSAALIERFSYNDMSAREFLLAFPYCLPVVGPALVNTLAGADAMARFVWETPGSFFERGRAHRTALVAQHGRLDPIIGDVIRDEMGRNWWRHLLTALPVGWCGMWVSGLWSLILLPLFAWVCVAALRRGDPLLLLFAAPALVLVALHAGIASHDTRYNLGLIGPLTAAGTWLVLRAISSARPKQAAPRLP